MVLQNIENPQVNSCFRLLQTVLQEAFQTNVLYYTPPYQDLSEIDQGIRQLMRANFINKHTDLVPSKEHPQRRFFVVQSNLGFCNIIVYLNYEEQPDFFSIGPFRTDEFSSDLFSELLKDWNLSFETNTVIQKYYERLPYASLLSIVNITKEIIAAFLPEFTYISPIYADFSEEIHTTQISSQLLQDLSADHAEKYQTALFHLCEHIVKGDTRHAIESLKVFLESANFFHSSNIHEWKKDLHALNTSCQMALMGTIVHPAYTLKLCASIETKIESSNTREALKQLPNNICHKYCLLVKNYAFPEYSQTIRDVINFIHLHLDEDLTLSLIAKHFRKNATSLSSAFSKEVHVNITNYIHQARIQEAIRLFNSTKLSVSEIALMVGFQDFAYFSRIFHKHVGCSPRDYCKSINR